MKSQFVDMTYRQFFWRCHVSPVNFSYWSKFHVNIITGSGVMTILVYKRLTRIWKSEKTPSGFLNSKFGANVSNRKLLNSGNTPLHPDSTYNYSLVSIYSLFPQKVNQKKWILSSQFLISLLQRPILLEFFCLSIIVSPTLFKRIHSLFNLPQTTANVNSLWMLTLIIVSLIISSNNQSNLATG